MKKKTRKKNVPSRQLSVCFRYGQHAKNNVIIISIQASTCTYISINVNGKKKKKVSNLEIQSTSILCVQLSISLVYLLFPLYIQFLQQRCFCCELQAGSKIKIADKVNEIRYLNIKALQISWDVIQLFNQCSLNSFEICKML